MKQNAIFVTVVLASALILAGCRTNNTPNDTNPIPTQQTEVNNDSPTETDDSGANDEMLSDADAMATINALPGGDSPADEASVNATKTFNITGADMKFNPSEIRVKKGDKVVINFTSGGWTHDLVIDEFNVATEKIEDGETDSIEFVADKTGTFEYYCSVEDHRAMGMVGKLIVE